MSRQPGDALKCSLARFPLLYRHIAGVPVARQNLLAPPQHDRDRRWYVGVLLGPRDGIANLVMDESLDDILLAGSHDRAADPSVIRLGPEVPRIRGSPPSLMGVRWSSS